MPESLRKYRGYLGGLIALALLGAAWWINVHCAWERREAAEAKIAAANAAAKAGKLKPDDLKAAVDAATAAVNAGYAWTWLGTVVLIIAFIALVGVALNNRPAGVLIDVRNRVSLSRLQMVAWTVLVISALATGAAARLISGIGVTPLQIAIPGELLLAMGIAVTSLVAAPALISQRATEAPAPAAEAAVADNAVRTGREVETVRTVGRVVGFESPRMAQWLDMFRGDEAANFATPDLSKIQQALITVVLIGVYAGAVWQAFVAGTVLLPPPGGDKPLPFLPPLDPDFIWLLGISHAGYLAYKATPKNAPAPANPTTAPPAAKKP